MRVFSLAVSAFSLAIAAQPAAAQSVIPIQFARGASSATLTGSATGYRFADYKIAARAGQRMQVSLTTLAGSPYFNILEPGSTDVAVYNSSMGEQTTSLITARSGAYTIRVYQPRSSARRNETIRYRLNVAVGGGGSAGGGTTPTHHPGDALVAGTPYHATSVVPCRSMPGKRMMTCRAGVVRRHGSATVHLNTPDGGERTILFRGERAISSDGGGFFRVERRGDTSVVRIGAVEVYEIPDALVVGG